LCTKRSGKSEQIPEYKDAKAGIPKSFSHIALIVLRFGAHQVLGMRVPSHAALSETVELAKSYLSQGGVGFVNGVLRRVTEKDRETWVKIVVDRCETDVEKLAVEYSHPQWVVRALESALKLDGRGDELTDLLFADNLAPLVNLAALPGLANSSDTVDLLPGRASPIGFELESGDPWNLVGVRDGVLRVQDQGSQLAALLLTQAEPAKQGEQWLDLCAGPGGKAALLAAEARLASATLTANELQPHRAKLVEQALQEVDSSVKVNVGDGASFGAEHPEAFDRILLDAPCTGLGALRRRPEARWRKSAEDVGDLTKLQEQLFVGAWAALKPGGILAYVTCSPHQAETNGVVSWAEKKFGKAFELLDAKPIMEKLNPELHLNQSRKTIQLWPHIHGTDAMYVALIRKAK
jgi:16S rRNA (cytosine967-C5)-methyltransferase